MAEFEFDQPEDVDGQSNFLDEPGVYHVVVIAVDEAPLNRDNQPLDGFRVDFAVLDGTVAGQKDRQKDVLFFRPNGKSEKGDEMKRRQQTRFALATGLLSGFAPGQKAKVDLQTAVGRQLVIEFERSKDQAGKETKFLQLAWSNIWHVDDPHVKAKQIPLDAAALSLLPANLRRKPEDFAQKKGNGGTAKPPAAQPTTPTGKPAKTAGGVNLDDL